MAAPALIYPMAALVVLSLLVLIKLFRSRVAAVRAGSVDVAFYRAFQGATEPEEAARNARHFANLFEAPTLFYSACLAFMILQQVSALAVVLAWLYVVARAVHCGVHLGANRLRHRIPVYFASWLILIAMWVLLVIDAATHPRS